MDNNTQCLTHNQFNTCSTKLKIKDVTCAPTHLQHDVHQRTKQPPNSFHIVHYIISDETDKKFSYTFYRHFSGHFRNIGSGTKFAHNQKHARRITKMLRYTTLTRFARSLVPLRDKSKFTCLLSVL